MLLDETTPPWTCRADRRMLNENVVYMVEKGRRIYTCWW